MAKYIEVTGPGSNPVYIPSEGIILVKASETGVPGGDTCLFLYDSGAGLIGGIAIADAAAARAIEANINASLLECINAGPDATGVVVNTTVFTSMTTSSK